jgi:integrase
MFKPGFIKHLFERMSASVKIVLFESKTLNSGECPVLLRVIKNRKTKYINLGFSCKPAEWDAGNNQFKSRHPNAAKRNIILAKERNRAMEIIDQYHTEGVDFTLDQFENTFRGIAPEPTTPQEVKPNVYLLLSDKIDKLTRSKKVGNARLYRDVQKSFFKFNPNKNLSFSDLTVVMLENYEVWLRENGCTDGGISVRFRTLRAIYNDAIKKEYANANEYPFKKFGVNRLKSEGIKKALTREEVRLVENLDLAKYPNYTFSRHLFVFSYYTRGMNFVDMMKLRWSDIFDDKITYIRSKTGRPFVLKIVPPVQTILDYFKSQPSNTDYVFPILLVEGLNPTQINDRKHKILTRFNRELKEIAQIVGIQKRLSSYAARHSFATNLKFSGVAISIISESLGHRTQEVTETYLKSFENSVIDEAVEKLL